MYAWRNVGLMGGLHLLLAVPLITIADPHLVKEEESR